MTQVLQIGHNTITPSEILSLLAGYRMLPQLWREFIVERAIATIELTPEERINAQEQFDAKNQLTTAAARQAWLKHYGMTGEQLEAVAIRELKIAKFKQATWGHKLESYFLDGKSQLDQVIYSLIRTQNFEVAQELYFRIQAKEQTLAELAKEYSQGPEALTGGLLGPIELGQLQPTLAKLLAVSQPGQLWPPTRLGQWHMIVRLEQLIPARLDDTMRQRLLDHLFETWMTEQIEGLDDLRLIETPKALVAI